MTAHTPAPRPPLGADTLERLRQISTPTLCTQLFKLEKVRDGAPLPGTYPPNEQTLAEYETWRERRGTI